MDGDLNKIEVSFLNKEKNNGAQILFDLEFKILVLGDMGKVVFYFYNHLY